MESTKYNLKIQKRITVLSFLLLAAKVIAFYITGSIAILTDALESIVNVVAGFIGLYSLYIAAKPKDREHPYGHGKAEFVSAAIEGTLIASAGIIILVQSIHSLMQPMPLGRLDTGLLLVSFTAIINYIAGSLCLSIGKKNRSVALQASGRHLQADSYSTLAIVAGLVIIILTQLYWLDKFIAMLMGVYIIYNGYKIVRESLAGIMDEQDKKLLQEIVDVLNENRNTNWIDLHNFRIIKYGSYLHIDCHLTVPWYLNVQEAQIEITTLMDLLTTRFGNLIEFFVHTDGCKPFSCPLCDKSNCPVRLHAFQHKVMWTLDNLLQNQMHSLKRELL